MTVVRAWRPLTRRQIRERSRTLDGGASLFGDRRSPEEREVARRAHLARLRTDANYRDWIEICVQVGHARVPEIDDNSEPAAASATLPVAVPRTRARQQRRHAHRKVAAKGATEDGPPPARVTTLFASVDDPTTRARAVDIIRELMARAEGRR